MSEREYVRLGLRILDEQIVDADGRRCGRVEDLELDGAVGSPTRVVGILCGATAWKRRLPPRMAELIPGDPRKLRRVPWEDVDEVKNEILLKIPESELEQAADSQASPLALSQLLGTTVVDLQGRPMSKVRDVVASRPEGSAANKAWELGVLVGRKGALQRLGFSPLLNDDLQKGENPPNLLPWKRMRRLDDEGNLVASRR